MVLLLGPLACGSVAGQESGILSDAAHADGPAGFRLTGVLISEFRRMALVDGQLLQEGDRLGGVEILAIDQAGIRVLMGAQEFAVDVGGMFVGDQFPGGFARPPERQGRSVSRFGEHLRHTVKSGETLSGIALRYMSNDATMNQMMIALFQSNPQAFNNNINVLHEGAVLRIPDENELRHHAPDRATVEVVRQTNRWQAAHQQRSKVADLSTGKQYGPVESGETLSAIAASLLPAGATMNQMMIALFQANPQAFSNNINVLLEGATLRIPDENELGRRTPATATAEVVRQTKLRETSYEQHATLSVAHSNIMAASDELIN
jgi:FimV-like protein